ncbi:MAG TPA: VOC family protein [Bacteroidia bacterium]|jgi:catechol 2,3-dioxygenase-like lactoylglutathione lyase family enzyme|nr:VOC family protein [Bacteroidia bacterium]HQK98901.1 VOC family protein [Bacteroidia bacterium]
MRQYLAHIAIVVDDYDKAINYYTTVLNFVLLEDRVLTPTKRWVRIGFPGSNGCSLLLAKASNDEQMTRIGNQTGGRVFLFLHTDDLDRDHKNLLEHSVQIVREPVKEEWGNVLVFADCYGNLWDLIQPA